MPSHLVETHEAGRTYHQGGAPVVALRSASCNICPRDRIALVGPSGSGKSTLLHLMGGLDQPTTGTVSWPALGPAATLRPEKIAFVFQGPSLLPALSAVENVEIPLLLGGSGQGARAAAIAALERIGLVEIADKLPEELSGGQAQRVAMARALTGRPALILADEPTGQLDYATAQTLLDALLDALAEADTALVIATHDLSAAARMERVWQMDHGVLEAHRVEERVSA
jgi:ABC-type lipoprotein export system ATPase subunit